jgi:hypothetical protein
MLQTVILTPEEWTPANGFLTAGELSPSLVGSKEVVPDVQSTGSAQKLQRKVILERFGDQIKVGR